MFFVICFLGLVFEGYGFFSFLGVGGLCLFGMMVGFGCRWVSVGLVIDFRCLEVRGVSEVLFGWKFSLRLLRGICR